MKRADADLTGYAALLGDSFAHKIDLLEQILQGNHYPSLGTYKERLLSNAISQYLPKSYEVATGFVLFAHEATDERRRRRGFDEMNMASHSVSKQCDLIIFDSANVPVVFRDGDFVVVRPESVRAIIEVKGTLNGAHLKGALESFLDFGRKWRTCQVFYQLHHQKLTPSPSLYLMCWNASKTKSGATTLTSSHVARIIAEFYRANIVLTELTGLPRLRSAYLYNEFEVNEIGWSEGDQMKQGYGASPGRFLRDGSEGRYLKGDRTVASLLASLHYMISGEFNRFYSYADEVRDESSGELFAWLERGEFIRDANTDYVDGALRHERPLP